MLISADNNSQNVNNLKCPTLLIQIRLDILYACSGFNVYANTINRQQKCQKVNDLKCQTVLIQIKSDISLCLL